MAASIYPHEPGSKYGPCMEDCSHTDCNRSRVDATLACRICGKVIGYGNRVYQERWLDKTRYVHADCLEDEVEKHNTLPNPVNLKPLSTHEEIDAAYPEHKKFTKEIEGKIAAAFQFVRYLERNVIYGAKFVPSEEAEYDNQMHEVRLHDYHLIYAAFGIDYDIIMAEKGDMLNQLRMRYEKGGIEGAASS